MEYTDNCTWDMGEEAGSNITRQYRKLVFKYSLDKIDTPDADQLNPWGVDIGTPALRRAAWTSRVQAIGNARDILTDVNQYGYYDCARPPPPKPR